MTSGSKIMCRQKVDTPWCIYRDFTVRKIYKKVTKNSNLLIVTSTNDRLHNENI